MAIETARVGIPEGFTVEESGGTLRIQWKWTRLLGLALGVFAIAWDSFLVSWYSSISMDGPESLTMMLFPIPHVAVGIILPYLAAAFLMNETLIEVGQGELTVRHRPLPFPGNRTLKTRDVRQLFCIERTGRKGGVSYHVMAQLASDREMKLVSGLPGAREARFIEQRIERRLGLSHCAVSGEIPG
jgi:hypothetical protein